MSTQPTQDNCLVNATPDGVGQSLPSEKPQGEEPITPIEARLHQTPGWQRVAGRAAALALFTVGSGAAGVTLTPTETMIGPHKAELKLTADSAATVDVGPLGSIIKPVDWPFGIGANIEIKEIPSDTNEPPANSEGTNNILHEYAQFLSNPEDDASTAKNALWQHAVQSAAIGNASGIGLYWLLGKRRRKELSQMLNPRFKATLAAGLLAATLGNTSTAQAGRAEVPISEIFDETPLEGATVRGKLLQNALNNFAPKVIDYWRQNEQFYASAAENVRDEFYKTFPLLPRKDRQTIMVYSDLHCNTEMGRVLGEVARRYKISFAISAGDEVIGGAPLDERCLNGIRRHLKGMKVAISPGNHDPKHIMEHARRKGYTVFDGKIVNVEGRRIISDADPRVSNFGEKIKAQHSDVVETDDSVKAMGAHLADMACRDKEGVDIVVTHSPSASREALKRGCAKLAISGHTHTRHVNHIIGPDGKQLTSYTAATAGGAQDGLPTIGRLQRPAEITIFSWNTKTNQPYGYQVIKINPDASVVIEPKIYLGPESDVPIPARSSQGKRIE